MPAPVGLSPAAARWLEPGRPRVAAAVLLLSAAASSLVAWLVLGRLVGVERAGSLPAALFLIQGLAPVAALLTAAAFALTGSTASRVLGAVTAVVLLTQPLGTLLQYWWLWGSAVPGWDDTLLALPFIVTVALHLAALAALARPGTDGA